MDGRHNEPIPLLEMSASLRSNAGEPAGEVPERPSEPLLLGGGSSDLFEGSLDAQPRPEEPQGPAVPEREAALPAAAARSVGDVICGQPWPCGEALAVVYGPVPGCPNGESTGRAGAESAGGHRGLFQLARVHEYRFAAKGWTWESAFDAERNTAIAYEVWAETASWQAWACRP